MLKAKQKVGDFFSIFQEVTKRNTGKVYIKTITLGSFDIIAAFLLNFKILYGNVS